MATHPLFGATAREQLESRRDHLRAVAGDRADAPEVAALLTEVDGALERLAGGSFGLCEACHDPVERDRLATDPLVRYCIDCLSEAQRRALEADLERAAAIQAALLPPRRVRVPGWDIHYHYEPAGPVSGDFCDIVPPTTSEGPTWFLLGDISGKGIAASLLMSNLHAIFRGLLGSGASPDEVVTTAGRMFSESVLPGHYATLICGRAHPGGDVELVSAGHPAPLLRRGAAVEALSARGLPLGLFAAARYRSVTARLAPGDALVLFTDGLSEALDDGSSSFGVERIARALGGAPAEHAEALTHACVHEVHAFRARDAERDDLTIMTLRQAG